MVEFDEVDVAIVDALRTAPRASWRELGEVLGIDPSTVSRRWARMSEVGAAWVTAHPSGAATPVCALVEIDCEPGRTVEAAQQLALDSEAATVKVTTGARDIIVLVQSETFDALSTYLLELVPRIAGVSRVRSHMATGSTVNASRWREGALNVTQRRMLSAESKTAGSAAEVLDDLDRLILGALHADGRMSFERLAAHAGVGALSVKRRVMHMQRSGLMTLRCDASRELSGRSVWAVYFGSLELHDLRPTEERVRALPGVRTSTFVAGPFNIMIDAWVRSAADVHALERRMSQEIPELRVQDRSVVLQMTKLLGHVLDADGRATSAVPLLAESYVGH